LSCGGWRGSKVMKKSPVGDTSHAHISRPVNNGRGLALQKSRSGSRSAGPIHPGPMKKASQAK
jgi:hypothetical protein